MDEMTCLSRMKSPRDRRHVWRGGVLQIMITRSCDKACFNCTQGSNLGGKPGMMTVEQFSQACDSLKGYFGVVGIFGGNPALHPQFDEICRVFRSKFPFEQRGLWCNHPKGKGAVCRITFNPHHSNLNVHLDQEAHDEFSRDWPECRPILKGLHEDSRHSPPFVAMQDVIDDEGERWDKISRCDVNQYWSSLIGVFRGELRAWFCELAGAQSMLHQHDPNYPDTGVAVVPGWWNQPMSAFQGQVRHHCHGCGIPLKGFGQLAVGGETEQVSQTHSDIYKPKRPGRPVQLVTLREELNEGRLEKATDYVQNGGLK
jgi:hypothetical protein